MDHIEFNRKKTVGKGLKENLIKNDDGSVVRFLTFSSLEKLKIVKHAMSTREGGISSGCYRSMNLSYTMGDDPDCVTENYERFMKTLGSDKSCAVCADQKHTANVRVVTAEDAGKGIIRERDYSNVDGHVTNVRGVALVIFASDCVPLFFADPVRKAIGIAHSGWRGTVARIGQVTIEKMKREYGTEPEDLVCGIGPSICHDCYEVSRDVAEIFAKEFPGHEDELITERGYDDKYLLDLWAANHIVLRESGVRLENIEVTDICTCCNPDLLFSHRKSGYNRGNNAGFLMLV